MVVRCPLQTPIQNKNSMNNKLSQDAHLAFTFDPQHDPLCDLYCLQPSATHIEKFVWAASVRVCALCVCVKKKTTLRETHGKEAVWGL